MSKDEPRDKDGLTREQRLAAKLRENLHRRKAQARAQADGEHSGTASRPSEQPRR